MSDSVSHPAHYTSGPQCDCGAVIECRTVADFFGFSLGNVIKYVWRADLKGRPVEDLLKARDYLDYEIAKRRKVEA